MFQVTTLLSKIDEEPEEQPPTPEELEALRQQVRLRPRVVPRVRWQLCGLAWRAASAPSSMSERKGKQGSGPQTTLYLASNKTVLCCAAPQVAAQGGVVKEAKAAAAANKEDKEAAKKSKAEVAQLLKLKEQLEKAEQA